MNINELFHQYALRNDIDYASLDPSITKQLLELIMNDKNSSTAREIAILQEAGYEQIIGKLDYDGIKDNDVAEVKLRNFDTSKLKNHKLNGEGSYSDYTWERFDKHNMDNPTILVGGFIDGRLVYIFKFKYQSKGFIDRVKEKLTKFFGDKSIKRKPNHYLRSLGFNFSHYNDEGQLIYIAPKDFLLYNEKYINKKLYKRLINESK